MPTHELPGTTALVTGASRGFGRAIAVALSRRGAHVAGVARDPGRLEELRAQLGGTFTPVAADAADPVVAGQLLDKYCLWVPKTCSTSCDQVIFVDQATDLSVFSDAVQVEIDRLG
jgi:NAD(P)-dependent dehydrogenase (short-subunit alcohol dehydrogenase family)